jgi:hypothetical protein
MTHKTLRFDGDMIAHDPPSPSLVQDLHALAETLPPVRALTDGYLPLIAFCTSCGVSSLQARLAAPRPHSTLLTCAECAPYAGRCTPIETTTLTLCDIAERIKRVQLDCADPAEATRAGRYHTRLCEALETMREATEYLNEMEIR